MGLAERLATLTAAELAPVVRGLLGAGDEEVRPLTWTVTDPGWTGLNPSTRGVFRIEGTAAAGAGDTVCWTTVLKVVGSCDYPGFREVSDGNYWKREPLALTSGLLQQRATPLVPVPLLAATEATEDEVWLWLVCLDPADAKPRWDDATRLAAAFDLGGFGAVWATDPPTRGEHPWLAEHWLRSWVDYAAFFGARFALEDASCWHHPQVEAALPAGTRARYVELMGDAPALLTRLEALPVTLSHHDAQWRNLFVRPRGWTAPGRTVALDWAFLGLAPAGADLGHMVGCDLEHGAVPVAEARAYDVGVTAAYLEGLRSHGWPGDEREVRFARAATAALQIVPALAAQVAWLVGEPPEVAVEELRDWPAQRARQQGGTVGEVLAAWATVFGYLLDLGDEARGLAGSAR